VTDREYLKWLFKNWETQEFQEECGWGRVDTFEAFLAKIDELANSTSA